MDTGRIVLVILNVLVVVVCHSEGPTAETIEHETNLIWSQSPFMRAFSNPRLMSIKGDPNHWVTQRKRPELRHIKAPHFTWEFKALGFHWEDMRLFWCEQTYRKIQSIYLNGSQETDTLFRGTSAEVHGLTVDWLSRNLYYTDALYNWIIMASIIPGKPGYKIVIQTGLDSPHGIAVDPVHGYLFWSDWGRRPKIERSDLLGQARQIIVDKDIVKPLGLAIDFAGDGAIYWVDAFKSTVEMSDLSGAKRKTVATEQGATFHSLALYQNFIFVTDQSGSLLKVYTKTRSIVSYRLSGATPLDLIMYDESRQPGNSSVCLDSECDQLCIYHNDETATCLCGEGFVPGDNSSKTCKPTERFVHPSHFYAIGDSVCHYPANMADMPLDNLTLGTQCFLGDKHALPGYMTLTFDAAENMLYYFSNFTKTIARLPLEVGAKASVVEGGTGVVTGMSLDWVSGNLYWIDSTHRTIMVSKKNGLYQKTLIERLGTPFGIAVHPGRGEMYWTDHGHFPHIPASVEKAKMDGTGKEIIMDGGDVTEPNHIFIDFVTDSVYWADSAQNHVRKLDLQTGRIKVVYQQDGVKFFGISIFNDYLVWTDTEDLNGVHMARLDTKEKIRGIIHPNVGVASDVITFDERNQPDLKGACASTNCQQLCLPADNTTYNCYCGLGYILQEDGFTCHSTPVYDEFLLVTDGFQKKILQVDLNSGQVQAVDLDTGNMAIAVTYDPNSMTVYWADNVANELREAKVSGNYDKTVKYFNTSTVCDGIAADYVNQLLFYTDAGNAIIGVVSLQNKEHFAHIITDDLYKPRDIVVSPSDGQIYWSDWGSTPGIERANMDGTDRVWMYKPSNDTKAAWINGLALDPLEPTLYWVDAYADVICMLNMTSMEVTTLYTKMRTHFFSIDVVGEYLYVTDWMRNNLQRIPKAGGDLRQFGPSNFTRLYGIQGYNSTERFAAFSPCAYSACEHLCLPREAGKYTCRCSEGYVSFNNGINCEKIITSTTLTTNSAYPSPTSAEKSTTQTPSSSTTSFSTTARRVTSQETSRDSSIQETTEPPTPVVTKVPSVTTKTSSTDRPTSDDNNFFITTGRSTHREPEVTTTNRAAVSKSTSKNSSLALSPVTIAIIACGVGLLLLMIIVLVLYKKKYHYRVNHDKLIEDQQPKTFYQIAFDGNRDSVTFDSGIENPTYDYMNTPEPTEEDL